MLLVEKVPPFAGIGLNVTRIGPSTPGSAPWMWAAVIPVSPATTQSAVIVPCAATTARRTVAKPALATGGTSLDPRSVAKSTLAVGHADGTGVGADVAAGDGVLVGVCVDIAVGVGALVGVSVGVAVSEGVPV
jgi:hypothetical protein